MTQETIFVEVAKMIGDSRLAKPLEQLAAKEVEIEVHNASFIPIPTADKLKRDIVRLRDATKRFEIARDQVSRHLLDLPSNAATALPLAKEAISQIYAMCEEALGPPRERDRRRKPGNLTCALIVIEAWAFANGKPPSANNEQAKEACEAYWRACGGKPSGNWQRMLKSARADRSRLRDLIQDQIRRGAE